MAAHCRHALGDAILMRTEDPSGEGGGFSAKFNWDAPASQIERVEGIQMASTRPSSCCATRHMMKTAIIAF